MQPGEIIKKVLWFSVVYFTTIIFVSYLYCKCQPWLLHGILYFFYLFYLAVSYLGRRMIIKMGLNPLSFLVLSFGIKLILVIGFAVFLITYFQLEQKMIILLYVIGYIIASIFDFTILTTTTKVPKQ